MLKAVFVKEVRDLVGSAKFVYTFAVSALLVLLTFYSGAVNHLQNLERWQAAEAENARRFEGLTDWLRVEDQRLYLKPQPLAALVSGVSNDIGRTASVAPRGEVAAEGSRYNEEPLFAVFRFLDLEFVFQVVLSLFAILLGYDAVCGEKERGTLKLCLANAVPRATFVLGKLLGSYTVLIVSLLIALGAGALLLPVLGVHLSGGEWLRLGLIALCGILFFGAFLSLSVFVSATTGHSANAFLVLLVIWVGSVLILPRAAVLLAGRAVEVPSVDEIGYRKASYASDLFKDYRAGLTDFRGPQTTDVDALMTSLNEHMDSLTAVIDDKMSVYRSRLNEERENRARHRAAVALGLARVSPSAALSLAVSELAGTSPRLKQRFYDQAMAYQPVLSDFLHAKTGVNVAGRTIVMTISDEDEEPEPIDPNELPEFAFAGPALASTLTAVLPDMGLLTLFNLVFFTGAVFAFNRYDAR